MNDETINGVYEAVDATYSDRPAATRRQLVGGAAATAEVLATIVNTVGREKVKLDAVTDANVAAAAREELIHERVLEASGGKPVTTKIHVPDEVFANATNLLSTLEVGDQIFINAYLLATTLFATKRYRNPKLARYTAEFMGVEAVHRALARQSLGKLGNDRAFMRYVQAEEADAPNRGAPGFKRIESAVTQLEAAGFGFGKAGSKPGQMYDFNEVSRRTPDPAGVNTTTPR